MTAKHVTAEQLAGLNPRLRGIYLGNFQYVEKELSLGDLSGNHFQLVLRDIDAATDTVAQVCTSVERNGFINYFGMQRFGASFSLSEFYSFRSWYARCT